MKCDQKNTNLTSGTVVCCLTFGIFLHEISCSENAFLIGLGSSHLQSQHAGGSEFKASLSECQISLYPVSNNNAQSVTGSEVARRELPNYRITMENEL